MSDREGVLTMLAQNASQLADHAARQRVLEVEAEVNSVLAERRLFGKAIAHPIAAILIAAVLWTPQSAQSLLMLFLMVTTGIVLNQISLWFYNRDPNKVKNARFWREVFVIGIAAVGLIWGIGSYMVYSADPDHNGFMITVLVAVSAVGAISYSCSPAASILFTVTVHVPLSFYAVSTVASGAITRPDHLVIVPFTIIFGTFVAFFSIAGGKHLRELIERRMDAIEAERRLDLVVRERTKELVDKSMELMLEKDRAQEASAAKSQFLANVSHELRTPLNAIIGFSEILKLEIFGGLGSDRYREYVGDIHRSGEHLLSIINDLLDLSKIEAGKFELHLEVLDIRGLVEDCLRFVAELAERKSLTLSADISPLPRPFIADRRAVTQILTNLLSNAVKFTPEKGQISIRVQGNLRGDTNILVTDTGIGMTEAEIGKCLEPFGQVDSWLARRYSGTGLGLPIVKALVDLHEGSFSIASNVGEGTTVSIRLPSRNLPDAFRFRPERSLAAADGD